MILLENFLQYILEFHYSITASWGFAIILLSISVNMLLLPVYMLAEHLQGKERAMQKKMQGKLKEIQEVFQGPERFMMIRSLYRIHQYHPVMGLRSLASLLVQIPFFFAAYNMLKHYDVLSGLSFAFIPDLHMADALIPFGRFTLNLLPFVMTAVNIYAAQIYARRKDPESLFSTWIMALLFLVLLYTAPAALVIYWTCNNIFSLIKNATLARTEHNTVQPSTMGILSEKIGAWLARDRAVIRLVAVCWIVGAYWVLSYFLIPNIEKPGSAIPNILANMAGVVFTLTAVILLIKYRMQESHTHKKELSIASAISMALGLFLLLYYMFLPEYRINLFTVLIKLIALIFFALPNVFFLPYLRRLIKEDASPNTSHMLQTQQRWTLFVGLAATLILIFLALPVQIYISDPGETGLALTSILLYNIAYTFAIFLALLLIYRLLPTRIRHFAGYVVVWLSSVLLVYAIAIPFDIGPMNQFLLMFPERIIPKFSVYIVEAMGILALSFLTYSFFKTRPLYILSIHTLLIIVLVIQVFQTLALQNNAMMADTPVNTRIQEDDADITSTARKVLTFSRTGENIVVLLLDMANGGYIQRILEEEPEFADKYDGFVWYPNTVSISMHTTTSKPAMLAGWNYTPENILKMPGSNLAQKYMDAYDVLFDTFQNYGYDVAASGMVNYGVDNQACDLLEARDIDCLYFRDETLVGYWLRNNNKASIADDISDGERVALVTMTAVLRSVPIVLKRMVYDKGKWNLTLSKFVNLIAYQKTLIEWSFIDSMDTISSVSDTEENTLKYIHSNITHNPHAIDKNCQLRYDVYPTKEGSEGYSGDASFYTQRCTLWSIERWIQWLKQEGIYDNTKIIIVSDHGNYVDFDPMNVNGVVVNLFDGDDAYTFNRIHALLMVKDFNAEGSMKTDMRLLSNADTASMMYHSIKNYQAPADAHPWDKIDPTKVNPAPERELPAYRAMYYDWIDLVRENEFDIREMRTVKDNIFYQKNWR